MLPGKRNAGAWADGTACHRADASTGPAPGHLDRGVRDLTGGWHDAGDYNKYLWYAASNAILVEEERTMEAWRMAQETERQDSERRLDLVNEKLKDL